MGYQKPYSKYSPCTFCGEIVSWDKTKRDEMKIKKPLTADETKEHVCDPQKKEEYQRKKNQQGQQSQVFATVTTGPQAEAAVTPIMTQEVINNLQEQINNLGKVILEIKAVVEELKPLMVNHIQYNPTEGSLNRLIDTLFKYLPELELQPQMASAITGGTKGD